VPGAPGAHRPRPRRTSARRPAAALTRAACPPPGRSTMLASPCHGQRQARELRTGPGATRSRRPTPPSTTCRPLAPAPPASMRRWMMSSPASPRATTASATSSASSSAGTGSGAWPAASPSFAAAASSTSLAARAIFRASYRASSTA
jgi:hypothetical protein